MANIVGGNLVASADDTAVTDFRADLDNGIDWLDSAQSGWSGLSNAEKQAWLLDNFGTVLFINLRVLRFIRWLINRL